jgi:hypothetical protein
VGFEPTDPFGPTVFKTVALDHSATPPGADVGQLIELGDPVKTAHVPTEHFRHDNAAIGLLIIL